MASRVNRQQTLGLGILEKQGARVFVLSLCPDIMQNENIDLREIDVIDTVDLDRNMSDQFHGKATIHSAPNQLRLFQY